MTLKTTLDEIKAGAKERLPAESLALMGEATEELRASGLVEQSLAVGQTAPDFNLESFDDKPFRLREQRSAGPLVLTFFRGSW